jgi:hypothetical protein
MPQDYHQWFRRYISIMAVIMVESLTDTSRGFFGQLSVWFGNRKLFCNTDK